MAMFWLVKVSHLGGVLGAVTDLRHFGFTVHLDRNVHQVTNNAVNLAADVTNLGKLGRFNFNEGRFCELREPPGNLGLADTGRSDHQNILRRYFAA